MVVWLHMSSMHSQSIGRPALLQRGYGAEPVSHVGVGTSVITLWALLTAWMPRYWPCLASSRLLEFAMDIVPSIKSEQR